VHYDVLEGKLRERKVQIGRLAYILEGHFQRRAVTVQEYLDCIQSLKACIVGIQEVGLSDAQIQHELGMPKCF